MIKLKPLFFELVSTKAINNKNSSFIGREWLYSEIKNVLSNEFGGKRGIIIYGASGSGKSSIILQLVENSCFGRFNLAAAECFKSTITPECYTNNNHLSSLAQQLVAYHFCQVESKKTCLVSEFIHSIAAQLCQAPRLTTYKEYLEENQNLVDLLSLEQCQINPNEALVYGILQPLNHLSRCNQLDVQEPMLIIIDSLCEAEQHCCDDSTKITISNLLAKHIFKFPSWLKLIVTISTSKLNILSLLPFHNICLDGLDSNNVAKDMATYIELRLNDTNDLSRRSWMNLNANIFSIYDFIDHLMRLANGNFLYLKLLLDLIEDGQILVNTSTIRILPNKLSSIFHIICKKYFQTKACYEKVKPIISTCLASLNPLTLLEIYHSINSMQALRNIDWQCFLDTFKALDGLLLERSDGTYMLFHSSFRSWLSQRNDEDESKEFMCDARAGHAAIAFRLSRIEAPLNEDKTLEFVHHILKAQIFKRVSSSYINESHHDLRLGDLQSFWMINTCYDLSSALTSNSNLFCPNLKVSRLLLTAGASPNLITSCYEQAPLIVFASAEGQIQFVSLLLEFGANINAINNLGQNSLHLSILNGHLDIVQLLLQNNIELARRDNFGENPLTLAMKLGDEQIVKLLLDHHHNHHHGC